MEEDVNNNVLTRRFVYNNKTQNDEALEDYEDEDEEETYFQMRHQHNHIS
jgi:hypothetical protein